MRKEKGENISDDEFAKITKKYHPEIDDMLAQKDSTPDDIDAAFNDAIKNSSGKLN
jgi:hypothetical protein